jgi:hypothetical protein
MFRENDLGSIRPGLLAARTAALVPVAVTRSPSIATADTIENRSSTVTIFPFTRARLAMAHFLA